MRRHSWLGIIRNARRCYLACSGPFRTEQGTISGTEFDDDGNARQDYVYKLAAAVRALAPEAYDSHLFALEVRFYLSALAYLWHLSKLLGLSE
jgi:hypothetical protein